MFNKRGRVVDEGLLALIRLSPCLACHRVPSEAHHVTTVKNRGGDTIDNVMSLCTKHHYEWHFSGPGKMCAKYPAVLGWLQMHNREDVFRGIRRGQKSQ